MPAIEIRPAIESDIAHLVRLNHSYTSDHVWQMDLDSSENQIDVHFREIRLPRLVKVEYPRPGSALLKDWKQRSGLLVALLDGAPVGYAGLIQNRAPKTTWLADLVVAERLRRQGIGSALLLASQEWALGAGDSRLVMEMQPRNYPAISLAQKLGLDFCGYDDHYYLNRDAAIFFAKWLR